MTVSVRPRTKPIFGHRRAAWRKSSRNFLVGALLAGLFLAVVAMQGAVSNYAFVSQGAEAITGHANVRGLEEDRP